MLPAATAAWNGSFCRHLRTPKSIPSFCMGTNMFDNETCRRRDLICTSYVCTTIHTRERTYRAPWRQLLHLDPTRGRKANKNTRPLCWGRFPHLASAGRQQQHSAPEVGDYRTPCREHHGVGRQELVRCAFRNAQPCLTNPRSQSVMQQGWVVQKSKVSRESIYEQCCSSTAASAALPMITKTQEQVCVKA